MTDKGFRRTIILSAVAGAVVTLGAAFAMDYLLADSLHGTWRDAAAKDVTRMFGPRCGQNPFAVGIVLVAVMGFLAAFGAAMGAIGGAIISRFFRMLLK
ncbi:MAG: hypothetical protein M0042_07940 [Nitrospiraceae bacterium]|nr:hypothetical protein [Nitrospiraceae bacterium]